MTVNIQTIEYLIQLPVINTVVKPRKCIDIVLRVNKIIKQLRCEEYFGGEYTYLTASEIAFLM
ncbi:hypothetical protein E2320_010471, partial [Naja naja]